VRRREIERKVEREIERETERGKGKGERGSQLVRTSERKSDIEIEKETEREIETVIEREKEIGMVRIVANNVLAHLLSLSISQRNLLLSLFRMFPMSLLRMQQWEEEVLLVVLQEVLQ
jgi:hypothetical protein